MTFGECGDLVKPVTHRVGAHAVRDLLELSQILVDLPGIDWNIRAERGLSAAERGVGDAIKLLARRHRGRRHLDRRAEPCPRAGDRRSRNPEKRGRNTHSHWSRPPLLEDGASPYRAPTAVPSHRWPWGALICSGAHFAILASRHAAALIGLHQGLRPLPQC